MTLAPGVYFVSGNLTMTGGSSITGSGVTFILLPGATITMKGGVDDYARGVDKRPEHFVASCVPSV